MTLMSKLDLVRQKRLESKSQSDTVNDNPDSSELETVTPEIIEDSIEADSVKIQLVALLSDFEKFSKNKEILAKLAPDKLKELEDLEKRFKNTLKFIEVQDLLETNKIKPVLGKKILSEGNLTANNSSMVMDTMFSLMIGKGLNIFQIGEKLCQGSKRFSNGNIDVIFRDIEYDLVAQYGEDTYQVFSILLAYWYKNKPDNWGETITLSGDEILEILNEKNKVIRDKNEVKRLSKIEGLNWVAHHCELLKGIRVYSSKIIPNVKGKKSFSIEETPLIEFSRIKYYPVGMGENYPLFENIEDLHISFKVGEWFKFFDDEKYIKQFGYVHKKAFSSKGIVSALLHWLSFKIEQNQRGEFKIETIIEQIGLKDKLEAIYSEADSKKASNLKLELLRVVMSALTEVKEIEDPYQWEFKNAPQWLMDNSKKPRNWFSTWLAVVIVFKHPECLIPEGKAYRREKIKEVTPEPKTEKIKTTEDLKYVMDKFKISIRDLVKKSENKFTYYKLQKSLNKENGFKESEIRELITYCYQINQSRKK
jgi:hypothetical protein